TAEQDANGGRETSNAADRIRPVVLEVVAFAVLRDYRHRQERGEVLANRDRPGARATTAVRAGERLVDVVMLHARAEVARPGQAEDRVHVRAVQVDERAAGVQQIGDRADLALEQAERVRVGDHEYGRAFVELAGQVFQIDQPAGVTLDGHHLEP